MARVEVRRTFILCVLRPATSQDAAERAKDAKVKAAARAKEARKRAATATAAAAAASAASAGGGQKAHCREPTQANTSPDEVTSR